MACGGGRLSPYSVGQPSRDPQVRTGSLALVLSGRKHGERAGAWGDLSREPLVPRPTAESPGGPGKQRQVQGSLPGPILFRHGRLQCQADMVSGRTHCHSRVGPRQVHSPFGSTKPHFPELNNRICIKGQIFKRGEGNTVLGLSEPAEAERQMKVVQVKPKRTSITQNLPRFQNLGCKFQKERIACPVTPQSPLPTVFSR